MSNFDDFTIRGEFEFIANKDEIIKLLNEGYTIANTHRILYRERKITTKYKNFYRLLRKHNIGIRKLESLETGIDLQEKIYDVISEARNKGRKDSMSSDMEKLTEQGEKAMDKTKDKTPFKLENDPKKQNRHY